MNKLETATQRIAELEAELAAMRAGGGPVAEMVPFHTPSGKRVAIISRFQHLPIGTKLYTHPSPPEGMAGWLNAEDMAALERADECFEDGEGHDLPKPRMGRLIEIGVMRHNGGGYYSITTFGAHVLGDSRYRLPLETLDECSERLGREHRERIAATPIASEAKGAI